MNIQKARVENEMKWICFFCIKTSTSEWANNKTCTQPASARVSEWESEQKRHGAKSETSQTNQDHIKTKSRKTVTNSQSFIIDTNYPREEKTHKLSHTQTHNKFIAKKTSYSIKLLPHTHLLQSVDSFIWLLVRSFICSCSFYLSAHTDTQTHTALSSTWFKLTQK